MSRRRVGNLLRSYRNAASLQSQDAAKLMGWNSTQLGRVERGLYRISEDELRELAEKLGVDDPVAIREAVAAAEEPPGTGWWSVYSKQLPPMYLDFIELEARAKTIRTYHPVVIPGLLQGPAYMRDMFTRVDSASLRRSQTLSADLRLTIRVARQQVLSAETNEKTHVLVPESAFHAHFESSAVLRDQARRILDLTTLPNLTIQLVPLTAHPAFTGIGPATILTYEHPWPTVVSMDNVLGGSHTEDPDQVNLLEDVFDRIAEEALSVEESRKAFERYMKGSSK